MNYIKLGVEDVAPEKYFRECCVNGVFGKPHNCPKTLPTNTKQEIHTTPPPKPPIKPPQKPNLDTLGTSPTTIIVQKKAIIVFCKELNGLLKIKEDYEKFVEIKTGLKLLPEFYGIIITSLKRLVEQQRQETSKAVEEAEKVISNEPF